MNLEEEKKEILEDINRAMKTESGLWMTTKEVSKYLKLSVATLEGMRRNGIGPSYSNLGKRKIIYPKKAIAEFIILSRIKTL